MDPHRENHQLFCFRLSKNRACSSGVGIDLFSRAASSQVSSAQMSLTSVFGMGTGGPSSLKIPTYKVCYQTLVHLQGFNPAMQSHTHMIKSQLLLATPCIICMHLVHLHGFNPAMQSHTHMVQSQLTFSN